MNVAAKRSIGIAEAQSIAPNTPGSRSVVGQEAFDFAIVGTDCLGFAPAVALSLEDPVVMGNSRFLQCRHDSIRLVRGDHLVFGSLEDGQGVAEAMRLVDGGTLHEKIFPGRIGAYKAVEIAGLELVSGLLQLHQVAYSVVGDSGPEESRVVGQGVEHGESPCGSAFDG